MKHIKKFIPERELKLLRTLYLKLKPFYHKSYSQEGEDMVLRRLFDTKKLDDIFYVDVGAHHPKRFSNTYYFYKKGARGINIDAMPGSMSKFNKLRPRDINVETPISNEKKVMTYYAFDEPALNTLSEELAIQHVEAGLHSIKFKKTMETRTLTEILNRSLPEKQKIDFLTIDVEDFDFNVLLSIDFDIYKPSVILIEIRNKTVEGALNSEISLHLKNYGYEMISKTVQTVFFKYIER